MFENLYRSRKFYRSDGSFNPEPFYELLKKTRTRIEQGDSKVHNIANIEINLGVL